MPATHDQLLAFIRRPSSQILASQEAVHAVYTGVPPIRINGGKSELTEQIDQLQSTLLELVRQGQLELCLAAIERSSQEMTELNVRRTGEVRSVELDGVRQWLSTVSMCAELLQTTPSQVH